MKQIESRRENLELAQKVYAVTVTKYQEGIGSSLEVTDAERQLLQSQSHMVAALYDLLNAKTDLMKAAGKL